MALVDVHRRERLELQPVDLLEAEEAVLARPALRRAVELEVLGVARQVADGLQPDLSAVAFVTATSLESVKGVGGSATMPCLAMPALTWS